MAAGLLALVGGCGGTAGQVRWRRRILLACRPVGAACAISPPPSLPLPAPALCCAVLQSQKVDKESGQVVSCVNCYFMCQVGGGERGWGWGWGVMRQGVGVGGHCTHTPA